MENISKIDNTKDNKEIDTETVLNKQHHFVKIVEGEISPTTKHNQQMQILADFEKHYNFIEGEKAPSEMISRETDEKKDSSENTLVFKTFEQVKQLAFKSCEKITPLDSLLLTQDEVNKRHGKIKTLEGDLPLRQGNYLARGIDGEQWPIKQENFIGYKLILEGIPDKEGFIPYNPPAVKRGSVQINEIFKLQIPRQDFLDGKAGDYMIRENARVWLVDQKIFEKTYQVSEEIYQPDLPKKETKRVPISSEPNTLLAHI